MAQTEYKEVPTVENGKGHDFDENPPSFGYGVRHVQAFIIFLCLTVSYAVRAHLGVTIVAMTTHSNVSNEETIENVMLSYENTTLNGTKLPLNNTVVDILNLTTKSEDSSGIYRIFNWPKSIQEAVLETFFIGYSVMMFPMGIVSQRWGGKIPIQIAMVVNAVLSFFSPWLISWGDWKALCVIRVLQGFAQAGLYPGIMRFVANWVPISERASLSTYIYTGSGLGTVLAFQLAGILGFSDFGWPSSFWVFGVACFLAFLLITIFGTATPMENKFISRDEKAFIVGTLTNDTTDKGKVPWKSIFTSVPAWATFITHSGNALCFVFLFIQVPTYLSAILKLNIRSSGILSSLPYFASFFTAIAFGFFSDFLTNRKILSVTTARKLSNSISSFVPAICLALVSYTQDTALATICFIMALSANSALHTGWMVNYVDLSPNYNGALMAVGNTLTGVLVIILPFVVSYIVTDITNQHQWRMIMFVVASITAVGNLVFFFFMSTDVQPWNNAPESNQELGSTNLKNEEISQKCAETKT